MTSLPYDFDTNRQQLTRSQSQLVLATTSSQLVHGVTSQEPQAVNMVQLSKTISDVVVGGRKQPFGDGSARNCVESGKQEHLQRYLETLNSQSCGGSPSSTPPTRKRWVTAQSPQDVHTFSPQRQDHSPESQTSSPPSAGACAQELAAARNSSDDVIEGDKLLQVSTLWEFG